MAGLTENKVNKTWCIFKKGWRIEDRKKVTLEVQNFVSLNRYTCQVWSPIYTSHISRRIVPICKKTVVSSTL